MDFIEWLVAGIGIRRIERPFIFISMGVAALVFGAIAVGIVVMIGIELSQGDAPVSLLAFSGVIAISFGALAAASGFMVKRCFDPDQ